jgi:hypothetical protein
MLDVSGVQYGTSHFHPRPAVLFLDFAKTLVLGLHCVGRVSLCQLYSPPCNPIYVLPCISHIKAVPVSWEALLSSLHCLQCISHSGALFVSRNEACIHILLVPLDWEAPLSSQFCLPCISQSGALFVGRVVHSHMNCPCELGSLAYTLLHIKLWLQCIGGS